MQNLDAASGMEPDLWKLALVHDVKEVWLPVCKIYRIFCIAHSKEKKLFGAARWDFYFFFMIWEEMPQILVLKWVILLVNNSLS